MLTRHEANLSGRTFLFLQGLSTPLFWRLGRRLSSEGAGVHRIHICPGDGLFWPPWKASHYGGRFVGWAEFVTQFFERRGVTDIIVFGDCRPYHRIAIARARRRGIRVHVFDEGLVRPHWLTMLEVGYDWQQNLPDHPSIASTADVSGGFSRRIVWDVAFHAINTVLSPLYPLYRRHRPGHPLREARGWLGRLMQRGKARRDAKTAILRLKQLRRPYFFVPLQLDSDAQIRFRSPFVNMGEMLATVMASFARNAPSDALLLVKVHPLDNGVIDRIQQIKQLAHAHGLGERVIGLDGGDLDGLLEKASGTVVVNSTVGLSSIRKGRPTKVLGSVFYDRPGLTSQRSLDDFWKQAATPDGEAVQHLVAMMMSETQINGSYFTDHGISLAIDGIVSRLAKVPRTR